MTELVRLLPCPFCGCSDIDLYQDTSNDYEENWSWVINCCNCCMGYIDCYSEDDAIYKWNKRVKHE